MTVGSIVFGPRAVTPVPDWSNQIYQDSACLPAQVCNCIGPQCGQDKCPCALRAESEQGRHMIKEGIVIDGQKYRLVPDKS